MRPARLIAPVLALLGAAAALPAAAQQAPQDRRAVSLVGPAERLQVATLVLGAPGPDGARPYRLEWHESLFEDHFLSMRPFRCLGGGEQLWCRVDYPYANARMLRDADRVDLEYDALFVWKKTGAYGIDLWNGVYFQLTGPWDGAWTGAQFDLDLNPLGVPPAAGDMRPIGPDDLTEGPDEGRRFTGLLVE